MGDFPTVDRTSLSQLPPDSRSKLGLLIIWICYPRHLGPSRAAWCVGNSLSSDGSSQVPEVTQMGKVGPEQQYGGREKDPDEDQEAASRRSRGVGMRHDPKLCTQPALAEGRCSGFQKIKPCVFHRGRWPLSVLLSLDHSRHEGSSLKGTGVESISMVVVSRVADPGPRTALLYAAALGAWITDHGTYSG